MRLCWWVQSGGGGGSLATVILEDEVMAEQNQDTSLLSACRSLMTAITKVGPSLVLPCDHWDHPYTVLSLPDNSSKKTVG